MQQTETYKLNLIEKTDTFSPDALNQNAQTVEGALAALQTAVDGKAPASLEGRVTLLEAKKVVVGSYEGELPYENAQWRTIELGFTPIAVFVADAYSGDPEFSIPGFSSQYLKPVENGFQVHNSGSRPGLNYKSTTYLYIAFG